MTNLYNLNIYLKKSRLLSQTKDSWIFIHLAYNWETLSSSILMHVTEYHLLSMWVIIRKVFTLNISTVRVFSALSIINAICYICIWVVLKKAPRICSPWASTNHPPLYIICKSCTDSSCAWQGENTALFAESLLAAAALWKKVRPDFCLLGTDIIVVRITQV